MIARVAPLPNHDWSGLLPPFVGDPTSHARSPYVVTWQEILERFATSSTRIQILGGLLTFRARLREVGITEGFQWLCGSFVEAIQREPRDVDVVTFCVSPSGLNEEWIAANRDLVSPESKKQHHCDSYFVELDGVNWATAVEMTAYWYGLFGHRRDTYAWKGILQLDLDTLVDDQAALTALEGTAR